MAGRSPRSATAGSGTRLFTTEYVLIHTLIYPIIFEWGMENIHNRRIRSTPELSEERFWAKVDKRTDEECWNWMGFKTKAGYGQLTVCQQLLYAHRFSWELKNGKVPEGRYLCHKCDNPSCVNPEHLYAGTQKDNMKDMSIRKRFSHPETTLAHGARNGNAKLTEEEVRKIRNEYVPYKVTQRRLAEKFNISEATVKKIIAGKLWKRAQE